jgi:hypothetical protein
MSVNTRKCDICGEAIHGDHYFEMILTDKGKPFPPNVKDVCYICESKIGVFVRRGMPPISKWDKPIAEKDDK